MRKLLVFLMVLLPFINIQKVHAGWLLDKEGNLKAPWDLVLGVTNRGNSENANNNLNSVEAEEPEVQVEETKANGKAKATPTAAKNTVRITERIAVKAEIKPTGQSLKVKLVDKNGAIVNESESTPSGDFVIEDPIAKNTVKIKSYENASVVIRDNMAAKTNFPLMVNLETNELMVTTKKGTKIVTVLPDAAVRHMLAANVLDQLGGKGGLAWLEYQERIRALDVSATPRATASATPEASGSADNDDEEATPSATPESTEEPEETPTATEEPEEEATESASPSPTAMPEVEAVEDMINLVETEEGTLAYEIEGVKTEKLFGMFKVKLQRTAVVSAETGELLRIEQSFGTQLLDLLSR